MKKILLIVAMIFVTHLAKAHVFLFRLIHEKTGNTNLIIDTDKQTINWKDALFDVDITTIKYSNICVDNPNVNNSKMSLYEKAADMQYLLYSSNLPKPKSIKASIDDIRKGKYGEGCIITIKGVVLFFKNEGKIVGVLLERRDQKEYISTFIDFMLELAGVNTSPTSPGKSSSTSSNKSQKSVTNIKSYKKCPDNNHPHMIDLGLPSGTKWACCNVGASKPEGYGGCYAWGETAKKSIYDGDTYKYGTYNLPNDDDKNKLVNIGSDIQGTQYDAATAKWGSQWVMPSIEQMEELKNNCTSEWTTKNGVKGRRFTGTNGASIFLPAVGYRWLGNARNHAGTQGFYWSSTLGESRTNYAFNLWFHSGYVGTDYDNRCHGYSVRPVRKN